MERGKGLGEERKGMLPMAMLPLLVVSLMTFEVSFLWWSDV